MAPLVVAPCADTGSVVGADIEGVPASGQGAGKFISVVERQRQIAWRMAFAAMREGLSDIGASIPFRALRSNGPKSRIFIKKCRPESHQPALVIWKTKSTRQVLRADRRLAEQIGLDRQ